MTLKDLKQLPVSPFDASVCRLRQLMDAVANRRRERE